VAPRAAEEVVLDVVRALHAQPPARGREREDGADERKVRHDHVAPGEPLAQPPRQQQRSERRRRQAQVGGEPHRRQRQRVAPVLRQEAKQAAVDVLLRAFGPHLRRRRAAREVVGLAADERVHEDLEPVLAQRVGELEAAEVAARLRRVDLQPRQEEHAGAARRLAGRRHEASDTSWVWHHDRRTYKDQTRDQYWPGRPSLKDRQSVATAELWTPARAASASSANTASICGWSRRRAQVSIGSTKPDFGRSNTAGSSRASAASRSSCFLRGGEKRRSGGRPATVSTRTWSSSGTRSSSEAAMLAASQARSSRSPTKLDSSSSRTACRRSLPAMPRRQAAATSAGSPLSCWPWACRTARSASRPCVSRVKSA